MKRVGVLRLFMFGYPDIGEPLLTGTGFRCVSVLKRHKTLSRCPKSNNAKPCRKLPVRPFSKQKKAANWQPSRCSALFSIVHRIIHIVFARFFQGDVNIFFKKAERR